MNAQKDNDIMRAMKLSELSHSIVKTNIGEITCKLLKGDTQYNFYLDGVIFGHKEQEELRKFYIQDNG